MQKNQTRVDIVKNRWRKIGMIMKLSFLLVCVFTFSASASTWAQQEKINLKMHEVSVKTVLNEIQQQTGLQFIFNTQQLAKMGNLTLNVTNETVEQVLNTIFRDSELTYSLKGEIIIVKQREIQQREKKGIQITGVVKDEAGRSLPGVTVRLKQGVLGTVTDAYGKYNLLLPPTLPEIFSLLYTFIGMETQEIKYAGKNVIDITMLETREELDEVVVTGYQVIDKRVLTSSIETIKADDLDKVGALTVDQMLEGKATGLMVTNISSTPGAASKVRIRSGGTFTGSRAPLWVVDGIIYEDPVPLSADDINSFDHVNLIGNALTGLNPQDIETINILKDASATAIYGTRAANGVIVVTTKRGKKGRASITYSGSVNVVNRPHYSDFNLMNSKERVDVSREIAQRNLGYPEDIFTWVGYEKVLRDLKLGKIDYAQFQQQVGEVETMNTDWFGELFRPAINTTHNVNLSGGTDNVRYYFSLGYNYNDGTERGVGLNRITARSNIDVNLRKNITVSVGMSGSIQEAQYNHSSISLFDAAYYNSRTTPFRNPDGSLFMVESKLRENPKYGVKTVKHNVMHEMNNSEKNVDNKDVNLNAQLNWNIIKGVKLMASASYRNTTNLQEEWITANTSYVAKLRTYDEMEDLVEEWVRTNSSVPFGGLYSGGYTSQRSLRGQVQLNLSQVIANKHVFNLNLGYEANSGSYKGSTGWTAPGYDHEQGRSFIHLPRAEMVVSGDLKNYGYVNMIKWMTGQSDNDIYPAVTDRLTNQLSMFAIFNYTFDNRYIFNFNMRSDGSNQFGQYERYKFKPTWSVSGRWNIHSEKFWNTTGKIEELALRLSYGFRGNPPSGTPYMVIRDYVYDSNLGENRATMSNFPNANLTWEKTSTFNAGLNFSLLAGRLSGGMDFAYSYGTDLLLSRPVSLVNGQGKQQYNGGEKKDYSYELSLSGVIIKNKNWGFSISGNATMTKEKILAGYEASNTALNVNSYLDGSIYLTGFPIDAFYSYQFDGLDGEGLPKFKNLDNKSENLFDALKEILTYSGRRSPKIYGGFRTEVRYKNLTMRAGFSYKAGHHTRLLSLYGGQQNMPMPHENMSSEFNNRWRQAGDEVWATIPALSNEPLTASTLTANHYDVNPKLVPSGATGYTLYDQSDIRVARAGHIRWQSISLSYSLPNRYLKMTGLSNFRLSGQIDNVAVWAFDKKIRGQDPEQVRGVGMPALPSYSLSLSFGF